MQEKQITSGMLIKAILAEVEKVIIGKKDVVEKVFMSILSKGHILLDDVPGVGKTTMATAISKVLGLKYSRVQFTPDVLPSDIVGFSIYDKQTGDFRYMPGVVTNTNILLGDEINRTSSKTQSALLEAMEEKQVTVDGKTYPLQDPFVVIATQNNVGTAGTQLLPYAQLDRFLTKLSIGYPDYESQMEIIRDRQRANPVDAIRQVAACRHILQMQEEVQAVTVKDSIISYITRLAMASRKHPLLELGVSPRGAISVSRLAKARAYMQGRNYAIPEDVIEVFADVCAHRIIVNQQGKAKKVTALQILNHILKAVPVPDQFSEEK